MWISDESGRLVLYSVAGHDTAMLLDGGCGLRFALAARPDDDAAPLPPFQLSMTVDQALALIHDLQQVVDWTRLPLAERRAPAPGT
jgi:hypothetical protein